MSPYLSPGTFVIFNNGTSRYVSADSSSAVGEPVKTVDALDDENPDNFRFVASGDSGRQLVNVANGLTLAPGTDSAGNSIVVWNSGTYNWAVPNSGVGTWDIKAFGPDSYWSDGKDASDHTIQLVHKADQDDQIQWTLFAA